MATKKTQPVEKKVTKATQKVETKSKTTVAKVSKKSEIKASDFSAPVFSIDGKKSGTVSLPKEIFGVIAHPSLIAQVVHVYLANQRQGTAHTKTRADVKGSGRKIYRQKGTGRARHGDRYAPIFVGGGVAHGPKYYDTSKRVTALMRRKALFGMLTQKQKEGRLYVVENLEKMPVKTKNLFSLLKSMEIAMKNGKLAEKILIATPGTGSTTYHTGRNIENVSIREANLLNAYEVMNTKKLVVSKEALEVLTKTFIKA